MERRQHRRTTRVPRGRRTRPWGSHIPRVSSHVRNLRLHSSVQRDQDGHRSSRDRRRADRRKAGRVMTGQDSRGEPTFTSEIPVSQQSVEARQEMRLRVFDWKRIRRDIRRLHPSWASGWFSAATLFLGLGVGAGLSLVSLYNATPTQPNEESVPPKTWVVVVH